MTRIESFLDKHSIPQKLFIYSPKGYMINKGQLKGVYVNDIRCEEYFDRFIDSILDSEECNRHTRKIINEILNGE